MKKSILCYGDSTLAATGFGVVCKHILRALWNTGEYDIHQLGINHPSKFSSQEETPWQIVPAKLHDPKDPYGYATFLHMLSTAEYDYVFIVNDTYVINKVTESMIGIFNEKKSAGKKVPIFIYYYPVDCHVPKDKFNAIELADVLVAYTDHGIEETVVKFPDLKGKMLKVYHGVDNQVFKPLPKAMTQNARKDFFHIDDDTYLIGNINKNSSRKQLAMSILAFAEFRKRFPKSLLYLHTHPIEPRMNIDLNAAILDLGLRINQDVFFPHNYNPVEGIPENMLNIVYNCFDMFLSTHLGEGFGLSLIEAMSCGVPVVTGNNTCMGEIFGKDRGYLYPCKEKTYIDGSGFRPEGRLEDILACMVQCKYDGDRYSNPKVLAAKKWIDVWTWKKIGEQWVDIFKNAKHRKLGTDLSAEVL